MSALSVGSLIGSLIQTFQSQVTKDPFMLLGFLIPILLIWFSSMGIRLVARRTKVDSPPTMEQKREKFIIPRDFFNVELEQIKDSNFERYLVPMESELRYLKDSYQYFQTLIKRYRKYSSMASSSIKRRKKRGEQGRIDTFNEILNLYNRVRKLQFNTVEFQEEAESE
ncbi:MAG TPA: hypothetical protein VKU79_05160 [Thermoplasmataceae archaeon]|nr:hypothetical protein [Thermoplasmatales archaeon AK]HLH86234.1 hypothetical protein [Thermoplasmataceae archaeon]